MPVMSRIVLFQSRTTEQDYQRALQLFQCLDHEDKAYVKTQLQIYQERTNHFLESPQDYLSLNSQLGRLIPCIVLPVKRLASGELVQRPSLNIRALMRNYWQFCEIMPEDFNLTVNQLIQRITLASPEVGGGAVIPMPMIPEYMVEVDASSAIVPEGDVDPEGAQAVDTIVEPSNMIEPQRSDDPGMPLNSDRLDERASLRIEEEDTTTMLFDECTQLLQDIHKHQLRFRVILSSDQLVIEYVKEQIQDIGRLREERDQLLIKKQAFTAVLASVSSKQISIIQTHLGALYANSLKWNSWGNKDKIARVEQALKAMPLLERGTAFSAYPPTEVKKMLLSRRIGLHKGVVPRSPNGDLDERLAGKTYTHISREIQHLSSTNTVASDAIPVVLEPTLTHSTLKVI